MERRVFGGAVCRVDRDRIIYTLQVGSSGGQVGQAAIVAAAFALGVPLLNAAGQGTIAPVLQQAVFDHIDQTGRRLSRPPMPPTRMPQLRASKIYWR